MTSLDTSVVPWHDVRVTFADDDVLLDAIRGLDKDDALRNAEDNWAGAKVEYLGVHDFQSRPEKEH